MGIIPPKYLGRCPNCGSWSSFVEEVEVAEVKNARVSLTGEKTKPMKLAEVTSINVNRTKTEMEEFNRVLGGRSGTRKSRPHRWGSWNRGNQRFSYKSQPSCLKWERFSMSVAKSLPSRLNYVQRRLGDIDSEFYHL